MTDPADLSSERRFNYLTAPTKCIRLIEDLVLPGSYPVSLFGATTSAPSPWAPKFESITLAAGTIVFGQEATDGQYLIWPFDLDGEPVTVSSKSLTPVVAGETVKFTVGVAYPERAQQMATFLWDSLEGKSRVQVAYIDARTGHCGTVQLMPRAGKSGGDELSST